MTPWLQVWTEKLFWEKPPCCLCTGVLVRSLGKQYLVLSCSWHPTPILQYSKSDLGFMSPTVLWGSLGKLATWSRHWASVSMWCFPRLFSWCLCSLRQQSGWALMCPPCCKGRSGQAFFRLRPGATMTSSMAAVRESRLSPRGVEWQSHAVGPPVCQIAPAHAIEASGCS